MFDARQSNSSTRTDWSMIAAAAQNQGKAVAGSDGTVSARDERLAREAWERLTRRYWPAVYAYIRRTGRDAHEAADLTQGFICDIMLERRLVGIADPARGRFRTLMLTALQRYLTDRHRHDTAGVRSRSRDAFRVRDAQLSELPNASVTTPEQAYAAQWAATIIREVLERVRHECHQEHLDPHWTVFEQRVVRPLLLGEIATPYDQLVRELGLRDASQASNMMITIKRRFVRALRAEIAHTIDQEADVEEELLAIVRDLERV
jgi:RNA polymerase sigma-70 factor (ECF subfamily)